MQNLLSKMSKNRVPDELQSSRDSRTTLSSSADAAVTTRSKIRNKAQNAKYAKHKMRKMPKTQNTQNKKYASCAKCVNYAN